jgi:hypothetical protein
MNSAMNLLKVTPIKWDAEFTSQLIDLETSNTFLQTKDRCQRKSFARHSQLVHRIRCQIDGALTLAEEEASRQQKIRQPTSITRHSQPRHQSVTTAKHSHSLAEGGTSRQRQMPTEKHRKTLAAGSSIESIAKSTELSYSQRVARLLQSVCHRSPKLDGMPSPRANSSTWRRRTPVSSPRIRRRTKVAIIQSMSKDEECSQSGIFSRSPHLDGIPSPRANSSTWRRHARIRRQTEVTIIIQIVSTTEECSQPGIFSRPVRQIRCQIDEAFALAEGGAS